MQKSESAPRECLIIADGARVDSALLRVLARSRIVIALDGAANHLHRLRPPKIIPHAIVGDLDSVSKAALTAFKTMKRVRLVPDGDQNSADLEKGIRYADQEWAASIIVVNALGTDRLDHSLSNLNFLKKYHSETRRIRLVTGTQVAEFVRDATLAFMGESGQAVGVFGFPRATVRSTRGLRYAMQDYVVSLGESFSSSNYIQGSNAVAGRTSMREDRTQTRQRQSVEINIQGDALVTYPYSEL